MVFSNNLLAGSGGQSTGYEIDQSIRFNKSASALMSRTFGTATDRNVFTYAFWMKACSESNGYTLETNTTGGVTFSGMVFNGGSMQFFDYTSGSANIDVRTAFVNETKFRDYSAWYHAMFVYNSDEGAASDRIKFFINGERFPSGDFVGPSGGSPVFPGSGANSYFNSSMVHRISSSVNGLVDGYMADIYFIDGQALDPTSFGKFSSTTGQFLPIEYSGSFGNNGFYIDGRDSSDLGDDESGNGNDFSTSNMGTDDQVTDSPTNNQATLNPLWAGATLSDGNLVATASGNSYQWATSTFAIDDGGKHVCEFQKSSGTFGYVGIFQIGNHNVTSGNNYMYAYNLGTGEIVKNASAVTDLGTGAANSLMRIEYDNSNDTIKIFDDGTEIFPASTGVSNTVGLTGHNSLHFGCAPYASGTAITATFSPLSGTPTSGFKELTAANLSSPSIALPEKYFNTVLYEGNGDGQRVGQFQPLTELYSVSNSVIFNDDDSSYLEKTYSGSESTLTAWSFSMWVKRSKLGAEQFIFLAGTSSVNLEYLRFTSSDQIEYKLLLSSSLDANYITDRKFLDSSSWIHIYAYRSSTTFKLYINGVELTNFSTSNAPGSSNGVLGSNIRHRIACDYASPATFFDGYLAEINFVPGTAKAVSDFGQLDASTNKWIPKEYTDSYGTNGFHLDMAVAPGTGNGAGNDVSGNNNDFTENNLVAADQVTDSPTKNFATLDSRRSIATSTLTDGNLAMSGYTASSSAYGTIGLSKNTGKWFWQMVAQANAMAGISATPNGSQYPGQASDSYAMDLTNGTKYNNGSSSSYGSGEISAGNVIGISYDTSNGALNFYDSDGNDIGVAYYVDYDKTYFPVFRNGNSANISVNFGQTGSFTFTPSGFNQINNDNLPLSSGELSGFVWIKNRDAADNHMLFDAVRGIKKDLHSNSTAVEATNANTLTRFLKNGFEISNDNEVNTSGESYVAWQWLQDSLTASSNTDGSITSSVLASTTSGFSIVSYSGNDTSGATVGHGLGADLKMIILKDRGVAENWCIFHEELGPTKFVYFTTDAPFTASNRWNDTSPTNSVFTLGDETQVNGPSRNYIAYCFAEVEGFSRISSYVGNGDANGPYVYTGFRPAFIIFKNISASSQSWEIFDNKRDGFNDANRRLYPNASDAEPSASNRVRLLSNGFKIVTSGGTHVNGNGNTIIYMAFAEQPFKTANAR